MEGGQEGNGMKGAGWQRRQRGRAKVWREDREMDGITGFRSRTAREKARDKEKKRERERKSIQG